MAIIHPFFYQRESWIVAPAFLKGASSTWDRFTSEFVPGGMIDEATDLEKDLAWMPATNDLNEGALGSY